MDQVSGKIKSFTDLQTWQIGHRLVLDVYKATRSFPKEEMFGLSSQVRRAAISFTPNIAEGFSRQSYKEKIQFYYISLGSLTEIQNQLLVARDVGYMTRDLFNLFANQTTVLNKMTNGLIKKCRSLIHDS